MVKEYQSLNSVTFVTSIRKKNEQVTIRFSGGFTQPYIRRGVFVTSDEELQKAIESDNSYGKEFRCITEIKPEAIKKGPESGWKDIEDVKTVQAAKDYLIDLPEVTASMVTNKIKVLEVAEKLKIRFPNLK
jgi:hypothetical protein